MNCTLYIPAPRTRRSTSDVTENAALEQPARKAWQGNRQLGRLGKVTAGRISTVCPRSLHSFHVVTYDIKRLNIQYHHNFFILYQEDFFYSPSNEALFTDVNATTCCL